MYSARLVTKTHPVEEGWLSMQSALGLQDREAFFAGAKYVWTAVFMVMEEGIESEEKAGEAKAFLDRIEGELDAFTKELQARLTR